MAPARVFARHLELARLDLQAALAGPQLGADERERAAGFRHPDSRRAYVGARLVVRELLSEVARERLGVDVAPGDWRFAVDAWGKPSVAAPELPLHFNLSKTRGWVLVAVAIDCELGCDIELLDPRGDELALARRYFHASEVEWLEHQSAAEHGRAFVRLWTLKEAYAKARGRGLSLGLDRIRVRLDGNLAVFEPGVDTSGWGFCERSLDGCQLAFACPRAAILDCAEVFLAFG